MRAFANLIKPRTNGRPCESRPPVGHSGGNASVNDASVAFYACLTVVEPAISLEEVRAKRATKGIQPASAGRGTA